MGNVFFWLIIMFVCFGFEVHTNAFVSIFIGFGATLAFVLALSGVGFVPEALGWIFTSVLLLFTARPLALRRFAQGKPGDLKGPTHAAMTNRKGVVESDVGDELHPGRVRIQGESWTAVTTHDSPLAPGTSVTVEKVFGTTLWVKPSR